jgi:5-hydroxyisourate hydrolase-like protein (transthyretin family)
MDSNEILTEFRGISTKIKNLQIKYDADLDALYTEIENKLKKELAGEDKFVEEFMKKMKENDPFSLTNSFPTLNTYWLNFLNNTASMKLKYNFGRTLKTLFTLKKQFFSEFFELSQRIITFLFTGSPKSWTEIAQYFRTYGTAKGIAWFATDLWVATHIGMPIVLGLYETFGNLVLLNFTSNKGEERQKVSIDLFGNIGNQYKSQYENEDGKVTKPSIFWGLLSPGHYYFDDLVLDYLDKSEKGEKRKPLVDWVKKPDWKKIKEDYKIPDSTQQKIEKILELPTKNEVDSALNNMKSELETIQQKADSTINAQKFQLGATEEGFKKFAGASYKSFNKVTTVGTKTDGTQWQYDESTSTWIPF